MHTILYTHNACSTRPTLPQEAFIDILIQIYRDYLCFGAGVVSTLSFGVTQKVSGR